MTIYFVLLGMAVLGGCGLCTVWKNRWGRVIYLGSIGLIFTVLAGVRYLTGYDYALYWPTFTQTYNLNWFDLTPSLDRMEKGYLMVNKLFANFTMEGCVIFFVFGAIYAANIVWFIHRYSSNPWMSVAAFLCFGLLFNSFCFMRQYTSAMILMWALIDIKENRPLRFLILVLLASTFHLSALIFLPFYVILKIPLNRVILPFAVMGGIIFYACSDEFYMLAARMYYQREVSSPESLGVLPWPSLGFVALLLICLLWRTELVKLNPFNSLLVNCLFYGTFFELLGIKYHIISRIAILFMTPAIILLVSDLAKVMTTAAQGTKYGGRYPYVTQAAVYILLLLAMTGYYWFLMHTNYNGVVPYRTIAEMY